MIEQTAVQDTPEAAPSLDVPATIAPIESEAVNAEATKPIDAGIKQESVETKPPETEAKVIELKVPDGSLLDEGAAERIAGYAKERGLSQEQAQEILNQQSEAVSQALESQKQRVDEIASQWREQVLKDKEIGGDNFKEKTEIAHRAVKHFASEDFIKALNQTQLGNHPELVRVFYRIGLAMNEDRMVVPNAQGGTMYQDPAEKLYGKQ